MLSCKRYFPPSLPLKSHHISCQIDLRAYYTPLVKRKSPMKLVLLNCRCQADLYKNGNWRYVSHKWYLQLHVFSVLSGAYHTTIFYCFRSRYQLKCLPFRDTRRSLAPAASRNNKCWEWHKSLAITSCITCKSFCHRLPKPLESPFFHTISTSTPTSGTITSTLKPQSWLDTQTAIKHTEITFL